MGRGAGRRKRRGPVASARRRRGGERRETAACDERPVNALAMRQSASQEAGASGTMPGVDLHDQAEGILMPLHDWTRVRANRFHDFHQGWTIAICNALNSRLLPPGYF